MWRAVCPAAGCVELCPLQLNRPTFGRTASSSTPLCWYYGIRRRVMMQDTSRAPCGHDGASCQGTAYSSQVRDVVQVKTLVASPSPICYACVIESWQETERSDSHKGDAYVRWARQRVVAGVHVRHGLPCASGCELRASVKPRPRERSTVPMVSNPTARATFFQGFSTGSTS
jgi:hypothetical protein